MSLFAPFRLAPLLLFAILIHPAFCGDKSSAAPATQRATDASAQRTYWESRVIFFGDESTNEWSLRIMDRDVDQQHQFQVRELWTYERGKKRWTQMDIPRVSASMVIAAKKQQDPQDPNPDPVQILAELPIDKDQMGLFYAKWAVDEVKGSTYFRIGPGLRERDDPVLHQIPPKGKILAVIPIDINHAEAAIIPDPRVVCEAEP